MQVLEARCPKCGTNYPSQILESLSRHVCQYCGASLETRYRGGSYFHLHRSCKVEGSEIRQLPDSTQVKGIDSNLPESEQSEMPGNDVETGPDLECVCPNCGAHYSSSIISPQHHQFCVRCGCDLELRQNGAIVRASWPGLKAEKYLYQPHLPMWENLLTKNLAQFIIMN